MSDMLWSLAKRVVSQNEFTRIQILPFNAEGVGKFQPQGCALATLGKKAEENHRNSEGVATVFVSYARRNSFRVAS